MFILPGSFVRTTFPSPRASTAAGAFSECSTAARRTLTEERPISRVEDMMLSAWPVDACPPPVNFTDGLNIGQLNQMSGTMFTGTVILSMFACLMASVPWQPVGDDATDTDDNDDAHDGEIHDFCDMSLVHEAMKCMQARRRSRWRTTEGSLGVCRQPSAQFAAFCCRFSTSLWAGSLTGVRPVVRQ